MTYYIYMLQNKINNKIYIGQTNNIARRKRQHRCVKNGYKKSQYICRAISKHGFDNFNMIPFDQHNTPEEVDKSEIFWIDFFQSRNRNIGYNHAIGGKVNRGFHHTELFKKEQSKRLKALSKTRISPNAKLTKQQASEIRILFITEQCSAKKLSKQFGISIKAISLLIQNKTYQDDNYYVTGHLVKQITNNNRSKNHKKIKIKDEYDNIFSSLLKAADYYNVTDCTIKYRIKYPNSISRKNLPKFFYL